MTAITGYWLGRAVSGGPLVPVALQFQAIEHEPGDPSNDMRGTRSPALVGFVAGELVHPEDAWRALGLRFEGGEWMRGHGAITRAEYLYRVELCRWSARHEPTSPHARPREAVDWRVAAIPFR